MTQENQGTEQQANGAFRGVFSVQRVNKIGTGSTTRRVVNKSYFYVEEGEGGSLTIQPLNASFAPSGAKEPVTKEELLAEYAPEPEIYQETVFPKLKELNKVLARADRYRKRGETFSAEMEYNKALNIDEENVRATFGIGICYMDRGETKKAEDILGRLVKLDAAFDPDHKHMFNEFGINLRKNKLLDQAVTYYRRALDFEKNDENLHYNLSRAYLEMGDYTEAKKAAAQCLAINPNMPEAKKILLFMEKKGL